MANLQFLDSIATLKPISIDRLILLEPEYEAIEHLPIGYVVEV